VHAIIAAAALGGAFSASSAQAEQISGVKSLDMFVHGTISQQCAMGQVGNMNFGDITRPELQASAAVQFFCNVPFQVQVKAAQGGLTNLAYPKGQGPYAGSLPYTIDFEIPVLKPASAMISKSFVSSELVAGGTFNSEGGIAADGLKLEVALGRPSGDAGLLAGEYSETIVITVSPI
jgi:hypothetical protein